MGNKRRTNKKSPVPGLGTSVHCFARPKEKFAIGMTDDRSEQEADRMADAVAAVSAAGPGDIMHGTGRSERGAILQERNEPGALAHDLGGGRPLDPEVRDAIGSRFGHDFSRVRVHADAHAEAAAQAVGAKAFTVGTRIVFDRGHYQPATEEGRRLLAHELTHVLQQTNGAPPAGRMPLRKPGGGSSPLALQQSPMIQRKAYHEDTAWSKKVGKAETSAEKLALISEAAITQRGLYPNLQLPVVMLPAEEKQRKVYHVYYDPEESDTGRIWTLKRTVEHLGGLWETEERYPPSATIPGESEAPVCVILGPAALSSRNPAFTAAVLYHEFIHVQQHEGKQHRALLDPIGRSKKAFAYRAAKETLAYAGMFKTFFGKLSYDDARAWEKVPGGRRPHDALAPLAAIEAHYWASLYDTAAVRTEAIELIVSAANTEEQKIQLRKLVLQLSGGNSVGAPNDFRKELLSKLS